MNPAMMGLQAAQSEPSMDEGQGMEMGGGGSEVADILNQALSLIDPQSQPELMELLTQAISLVQPSSGGF